MCLKKKLSSTPSPLRPNLKDFITVLCLLVIISSPPPEQFSPPPEMRSGGAKIVQGGEKKSRALRARNLAPPERNPEYAPDRKVGPQKMKGQ